MAAALVPTLGVAPLSGWAMTPYYADEWLTVYGGDSRTVMATLPADSVDCVVTSPPYWGLRDYGTATWVVSDIDDETVGREFLKRHWEKSTEELRTELGVEAADHDHSVQPDAGVTSQRVGRSYQQGHPHRRCPCGATRVDSQLGLERTPEEYVANMVAVFAEVRRVLKPSGTCWLNLGDSYQNAKGQAGGVDPKQPARRHGLRPNDSSIPGLKPKDLVGIPWRVAFALQADGWYLRSDIIWSKPNPMPESVTDRPTKSHEYLFLLTKSARYQYDAAAIAEYAAVSSVGRWSQNLEGQQGSDRANGGRKTNGTMKAVGGKPRPGKQAFVTQTGGVDSSGLGIEAITRNARSVWTIATRPYADAHFAVFPPELPERCIKAGSPEGGTVLDPFAGSGTVGLVANRLSRRAILIDLNPEYLKQQMRRNAQTPLGLEVPA